MRRLSILLLILCSFTMARAETNPAAKIRPDHVVLLHGMKRAAASMNEIATALQKEGYQILNLDYPSSEKPIEELAELVHAQIVKHIPPDASVHFVTHSMGGILARYYIKNHRPHRLGRVVMLAPPNQGTEMSDFLQGTGLFEKFFGPAGTQLGTNKKSITHTLGPVDYEVGVVMGNISLNPIASVVVEGDDDGLVSHKRSEVVGMKDSIILPAAHSFIVYSDEAVRQSVHFLNTGRFDKSP